jgi:hypothetical protein
MKMPQKPGPGVQQGQVISPAQIYTRYFCYMVVPMG